MWQSLLLCIVVVTVVSVRCQNQSPAVYEYKYQTIKTTWVHAETLCHQWGGNLATVTSEKENDFLLHQMTLRHMPSAWIGLNDRAGEGAFEWASKPRHQFTNWQHGEPNNWLGGEKCVVMYVANIHWKVYNGEWNDAPCSNKMPYICQRTTKGGDKEYQYVEHKATWEHAREVCKLWSGTLVVINSKSENDQFVKELKKRNMNGAWIGLNDIHRNGVFEWADVSKGFYQNFRKNQPDGKTWENCVEIVRESRWFSKWTGEWNDAPCSYKYPSICKKEAAVQLRCSGEDNGCCTPEKPCDMGEGDCDNDSHCSGNLVCGHDNCPWGDKDDCCMAAS